MEEGRPLDDLAEGEDLKEEPRRNSADVIEKKAIAGE